MARTVIVRYVPNSVLPTCLVEVGSTWGFLLEPHCVPASIMIYNRTEHRWLDDDEWYIKHLHIDPVCCIKDRDWANALYDLTYICEGQWEKRIRNKLRLEGTDVHGHENDQGSKG